MQLNESETTYDMIESSTGKIVEPSNENQYGYEIAGVTSGGGVAAAQTISPSAYQ